MKCGRCFETIRFVRGTGWVHQDGNVYKQREMTEEEKKRWKERGWKGSETVDDHCVLPVPD